MVGQREDRRMGVYAPQLQKGTCVSCPPTSVGSSSVGPFRFSLTPVNASQRWAGDTRVDIYYIVCTEPIMAPPGNGSCRQRGGMEYVQNDLVNECISRSLWCVCVCGGVWGCGGGVRGERTPALFLVPSSPLNPFLQGALGNSRLSGRPPSGALVKELESKEG